MEQEEVLLDEKLQKEIEAKVKALKASNPKFKRIFPFYVMGDPEEGEKDVYIGYFKQPPFTAFSKWMALSKTDEAGAMRELAKDCFVGGDEELYKDDSLFLYGLLPNLNKLVQMRKSGMANFSNNGK